jgi:tetratricopeptide (TPR) repeat protein
VADAALRLTFYQPPLSETNLAPPPPTTQLVLAYQQAFALDRGDASAGDLYAAVRAARRAIADNPTDAAAYLVLGKAYRRLLDLTPERRWADRMPQLLRVRQVQTSAALNRAVALNPRLAEAHLELGLLYQHPALGCLDLAATHLRKYLELTPPRPGNRGNDARAAVEAGLERLAAEVDRQTREFARESERVSVSDRAALANRRRLGGTALDLLVKSDVAAFGVPGTELELDLLLRTGRPREVLDWLTNEVRASIGDFSYHLLRGQAFAALGDYAAADAELAEVAVPGGGLPDPGPVAEAVAGLVGKVLLDDKPGQTDLSAVAWRVLSRADFQNQLIDLTGLLSRQGDAMVVRGLVALEAGAIDAARTAFRAALTFAPHRLGGERLDFNGRPIAWDALGMIDRRGP